MNCKRGNKTAASIKAWAAEWQYPAVWIAGLMDSVYVKALHCCTIANKPNKYNNHVQYLLWTHSYGYAQTHCSNSLISSLEAKNEPFQFFYNQLLPSAATHNFV